MWHLLGATALVAAMHADRSPRAMYSGTGPLFIVFGALVNAI